VVGSPGVTERNLSPNIESLDAFAFEPEKTEKPWGWELLWACSDRYAGKLLFVEAGHRLSLQFHKRKHESWYVQSGRAELEMAHPGEATPHREIVGPGAAFRIEPGTVHRIRAIEDTLVLEVSTPDLDDVVRLEDAYGREGTSDP
jgi:mannose-6-phosphate isomerase-like protein (cupin superfamily)